MGIVRHEGTRFGRSLLLRQGRLGSRIGISSHCRFPASSPSSDRRIHSKPKQPTLMRGTDGGCGVGGWGCRVGLNRCFWPCVESTNSAVSHSPSGPAGGASVGYGPERGAAGPFRRCACLLRPGNPGSPTGRIHPCVPSCRTGPDEADLTGRPVTWKAARRFPQAPSQGGSRSAGPRQ